ncbi:Palmitoyltransferase [Lineolata rhizophorae]|uniref:Palmitoyltransferase PFA4 n=1 Tax=Lineolata rhizophorae TaxID=578093 RepID=A0A6A6NYN5_9PEZI|nr:Palmitoyltransferase [Lineolata rhizophorae]
MDGPWPSKFAVPAVLSLISFLSFSSQYLILQLDPGPLDYRQTLIFNSLIACLLISYARACVTDPGRIPEDWLDQFVSNGESKSDESRQRASKLRRRWCSKCNIYKPPRAHHCKSCQRCILKMDHHCPWTVNCVSHVTFPHFIRFVFFAVAAMAYLEKFLYDRAAVIWENRHLPSYLGPTVFQLVHFFLLVAANSLTLFVLAILLVRTLWCLAVNTTTIEEWEIERHETLLRRARYLGGYLNGPDGQRVRIVKQEFPYDIGIWKNLKQGMGTWNFLAWLWPLSASPSVESGLEFEENGFEDTSVSWPPPDPDRIPRIKRTFNSEDALVYNQYGQTNDREDIEAFRRRQAEDLKRWNSNAGGIQRRKPFYTRATEDGRMFDGSDASDVDIGNMEGGGEEGWRNSEGERLRDFGVDEDVEFYDEDDVPLAELIARKKAKNNAM